MDTLVTTSLTCSFAAIYHLNFPRPAPVWPCSSVGRATLICSGGRGFESHRDQSEALFLSPNLLCDYFLSEGITWPKYLGYLHGVLTFHIYNVNPGVEEVTFKTYFGLSNAVLWKTQSVKFLCTQKK